MIGTRNKNNKKTLTFKLLCIIGTCTIRIYLPGLRALVEADESAEEVVVCSIIVRTSVIVQEVEFEWQVGQFLSKKVHFIQKWDLRCDVSVRKCSA